MRAAYDPVERVEFWSVNNGILVAEQHLSAIFEGVHDNSSRVSQLDLENGLVGLTPPSLTDAGMIITELQQVTKHRYRTSNLWQSLDMRNVCGPTDLLRALVKSNSATLKKDSIAGPLEASLAAGDVLCKSNRWLLILQIQ